MKYPNFVRIRQHFERPRIDDIPAAVTHELEKLQLPSRIRPGQSVAVTAGSRGIANIPLILKATCDFLKKLGAQPFLVPTMGSHGGGTADGQQKILESYGMTQSFTGVPIRASMDVVQVDTTPEGWPVYLDRHASEADHIAVVARIKPHTAFHGPIESGLMKMMLIGLGKHVGALFYHRVLLEQPYDKVVRSIGRSMLAKAPIAFGLGIVENAYDETALIEGVPTSRFVEREEALLVRARDMLPRLPVTSGDLVIVDRIGKDISGSGMDTNVIGRKRAFRGQPAPPEIPNYRLIHVRGLTQNTHGNASGIGLADFTLRRLVQNMNYDYTVINCLTAGYPEGAFLPVQFDNDRQVVEAALAIIGTRSPAEGRVLHIRDTLHTEELIVSEPLLGLIPPDRPYTPIGTAFDLRFDDQGMLADV